MKKSHIVGIIVIVIAFASIMTSLSNNMSYANFSEAFNNKGKKYTVVGKINLEKEITALPNSLSFFMLDEKGKEKMVTINQPKPQDFERAENITITGRAEEKNFHATSIQMKCPSKYNEKKLTTISENK